MCVMKKLLLAVICVSLSCGFVLAENSEYENIQTNQGYNTKMQDNMYQLDAKTLKNSIVTVPAGLNFKGVFLSPVSSETATPGQEISLALVNDFYYKDKKLPPQAVL